MLFLRGSSAPVSQRPNTIALKDVLNIPKASSMYKSHKILERETSVFIHAKYFIQIFFLQFFVLLQIVIASGYVVGPCHHGMARPQVADRGTASDKEGSCE